MSPCESRFPSRMDRIRCARIMVPSFGCQHVPSAEGPCEGTERSPRESRAAYYSTIRYCSSSIFGGNIISEGLRVGHCPTLGKEMSLEFAARGGLLESHAAGGDVGAVIVFSQDGGTGEAAQHCHLADVSQCVRNRSLEQSFGGSVERFGGS